MNETNSHLPPVQGGNGLFVPITLEEMAKSPEIFDIVLLHVKVVLVPP